MRQRAGAVLLGVSVAAVVATVLGGLFVLGPPAEERARRLDGRRVTDLRGIEAAVDLYWTRHGRLPSSLEELTAEPGVNIVTRDPVSSEAYAYRTLDSPSYELCASFEEDSGEMSREAVEIIWAHGSGRQCFELEADEVGRRDEVDRDQVPRV